MPSRAMFPSRTMLIYSQKNQRIATVMNYVDMIMIADGVISNHAQSASLGRMGLVGVPNRPKTHPRSLIQPTSIHKKAVNRQNQQKILAGSFFLLSHPSPSTSPTSSSRSYRKLKFIVLIERTKDNLHHGNELKSTENMTREIWSARPGARAGTRSGARELERNLERESWGDRSWNARAGVTGAGTRESWSVTELERESWSASWNARAGTRGAGERKLQRKSWSAIWNARAGARELEQQELEQASLSKIAGASKRA